MGAIGETGSIALIERFWRSMKGLLHLRSFKPVHRADLERRLGLVVPYYASLRPHQGLGGSTPAEVYLGLLPAHLAAVPPPRGRPGEIVAGVRSATIDHLDPERRLPFLRAAA